MYLLYIVLILKEKSTFKCYINLLICIILFNNKLNYDMNDLKNLQHFTKSSTHKLSFFVIYILLHLQLFIVMLLLIITIII